MVLNFCLGHCKDLEYNCRFSTLLTIKLEIRVSQKLEKLAGGGGGRGEAHKMSGMEGGDNWSKLCSLGGRVSTLALISFWLE